MDFRPGQGAGDHQDDPTPTDADLADCGRVLDTLPCSAEGKERIKPAVSCPRVLSLP